MRFSAVGPHAAECDAPPRTQRNGPFVPLCCVASQGNNSVDLTGGLRCIYRERERHFFSVMLRDLKRYHREAVRA